MKTFISRHNLTIACLIAMGISASGCIVINNADDSVKGRRIEQSTLKQFEAGKTTKDWTIAVLGKPSSEQTLDGGLEVLRYEYSRRKEQQTLIFLLFAGNVDKKDSQTTYFEFQDGILTRHWVEKD